MKYVGIDFSINSPAICIYDFEKGTYDFHAFHHYKTLKCGLAWTDKDRKVHINLDQYPSSADKYTKYRTVAEMMFCFIREHTEREESMVWIEDYNYNPRSNRNNIIDIVEATTFLKIRLIDWFRKIHVANISTIKMVVLGRGNAEKSDAVDKFVEVFSEIEGIPSVPFDMLNGKIGQHLLKDKNWASAPFQDIVDAWAVCEFGMIKNKSNGVVDGR